jgi:hypothetical protein
MTRIFTCAVGAIVLAAGIASSQTQPPTTTGGQAGTRTTGTGQKSTTAHKSTAARSTTYSGCLQGSSADGYTISVLPNGTAQRQHGRLNSHRQFERSRRPIVCERGGNGRGWCECAGWRKYKRGREYKPRRQHKPQRQYGSWRLWRRQYTLEQ